MHTTYMTRILLALVTLVACERDDDVYDPANKKGMGIDAIIKFDSVSTASNPVDADSVSISYIDVVINPEAAANQRQVIFTTTLGHFLNWKSTMAVTADAGGHARVGLKSAVPGRAFVSATVSSVTIDTTIGFQPALPTRMMIVRDKYVATRTDEIIITTTLFRDAGMGITSDPLGVWFDIRNTDGSTLPLEQKPVFPLYAVSANHVVAFTALNPFEVTGTFRLEAKTLAPNDTARAFAIIRIQ